MLSIALATTSLLDEFSDLLLDMGETVSVFSRQAVWFRAIQLFVKSPVWGYGIRTNDGYRELINVLAMDYVHLMTYAMVALILVGPEILKIFADQRYWEGMSIIPPIALANYMIFMYTMYVYIEHYYKKTVYITKNTLIAAGLNVILNFILIPKYGYVAAAYTTLASYFVAFILHSRYAKKIEPDIYPLKMFALPLLHVGGAIILYYPLLNFWTLRWGILFVYLIIVLIKERFRIGTLVPVLAEKCSFFKEK